ncbi:MAG: hypothetical protein FJZ01_23750 [Candidatus Sericytochromatia bacterium]|nr:hypothetical protein [Candidatus Tanganyikabacteria bacterium]MBM4270512.1 hypothetical protein [Deltaproteobacteria bacterium]
MSAHAPIDWNIPARRAGFPGFVDSLFGPGLTTAELILQLGAALALTAGAAVAIAVSDLGWGPWQVAVIVWLVFDITGGVVTNATSSAKRWWHRPERRRLANDLRWSLAHFYMPLLMWTAFPSTYDWVFFAGSWGYLLVGTMVLGSADVYLRRPLAFVFYLVALALGLYVFPSERGTEWFIPVFYMKHFISHLLPEEPYRPSGVSPPVST